MTPAGEFYLAPIHAVCAPQVAPIRKRPGTTNTHSWEKAKADADLAFSPGDAWCSESFCLTGCNSGSPSAVGLGPRCDVFLSLLRLYTRLTQPNYTEIGLQGPRVLPPCRGSQETSTSTNPAGFFSCQVISVSKELACSPYKTRLLRYPIDT